MARPPQTFEYFFDLPPELREQILSYLVIAPNGLHYGDAEARPHCETAIVMNEYVASSSDGNEDDSDSDLDDGDSDLGYDHTSNSAVPWPLNYFLASVQLYRETSSIFFAQNTFHLHATARKSQLTDPESEHGLLANPAFRDSRRRIRRVVLTIRRIGGNMERFVAPPLLDMMLAGALRDLELRIALLHPGRSKGVAGVIWHLTMLGLGGQVIVPGASRGRGSEGGAGVWSSAPFQVLLGMLSDPDLERARLRVAGACHDVVWCPFHEMRGQGGDGDGDGQEGMTTSLAMVEEGEAKVIPGCEMLGSMARCLAGREWLDIDLQALGGMYGGSKILKVGD